jgi:hypothetical protein
LQTGTPLGNEKFKAEIEVTLDIKGGFTRRGRPKKQTFASRIARSSTLDSPQACNCSSSRPLAGKALRAPGYPH